MGEAAEFCVSRLCTPRITAKGDRHCPSSAPAAEHCRDATLLRRDRPATEHARVVLENEIASLRRRVNLQCRHALSGSVSLLTSFKRLMVVSMLPERNTFKLAVSTNLRKVGIHRHALTGFTASRGEGSDATDR